MTLYDLTKYETAILSLRTEACQHLHQPGHTQDSVIIHNDKELELVLGEEVLQNSQGLVAVAKFCVDGVLEHSCLGLHLPFSPNLSNCVTVNGKQFKQPNKTITFVLT